MGGWLGVGVWVGVGVAGGVQPKKPPPKKRGAGGEGEGGPVGTAPGETAKVTPPHPPGFG